MTKVCVIVGVVSGRTLRVAQKALFVLGYSIGLYGLLMIIGLSRSPDGYRPAPFVGLVILGAAMLVFWAGWRRRSGLQA